MVAGAADGLARPRTAATPPEADGAGAAGALDPVEAGSAERVVGRVSGPGRCLTVRSHLMLDAEGASVEDERRAMKPTEGSGLSSSRRYGTVASWSPSRRSGPTGCSQRADRKLSVVSRPVGRLRSHPRPAGLRTSGLTSGWFSASGRASGPSGHVIRDLGRCQAADHGRPGLLSWAECCAR